MLMIFLLHISLSESTQLPMIVTSDAVLMTLLRLDGPLVIGEHSGHTLTVCANPAMAMSSLLHEKQILGVHGQVILHQLLLYMITYFIVPFPNDIARDLKIIGYTYNQYF